MQCIKNTNKTIEICSHANAFKAQLRTLKDFLSHHFAMRWKGKQLCAMPFVSHKYHVMQVQHSDKLAHAATDITLATCVIGLV